MRRSNSLLLLLLGVAACAPGADTGPGLLPDSADTDDSSAAVASSARVYSASPDATAGAERWSSPTGEAVTDPAEAPWREREGDAREPAISGVVASDVACLGCVDSPQIAADAVAGRHLQPLTVRSQHLAGDIAASKIVDGDGSGLDADSVDGLQADAFLRQDTSGTLDGDLSVSGGLDASELCIGGDCQSAWPTDGVAGAGSAGALALWTSTSALDASALYFDSGTGKLGVNTASPAQTLDVDGGAVSSSGIELGPTAATGSEGGQIGIRDRYGDLRWIIDDDAADDLRVFPSGADGDVLLHPGGTGRVGVGVAAPERDLEVGGRLYAGDAYDSYGDHNDYHVLTTPPDHDNSVLAVRHSQPEGFDNAVLELGALAESSSDYHLLRGYSGDGSSDAYDQLQFSVDGAGAAYFRGTGDFDGDTLTVGSRVWITDASTSGDATVRADHLVVDDTIYDDDDDTVNVGENLAVAGGITAADDVDLGGDLSIDNGEAATLYSSAHSLYFKGLSYAHRTYHFMPGPGSASTTNAKISIYEADTSSVHTEKVRLHSTGDSFFNGGDVGIGTSSPAYKLDVDGDINGDELCIAGDCRTTWPTGGSSSSGVTGSGTSGYIPKWSSGTGLSNSILHETGGNIDLSGSLYIDSVLYGPSDTALTLQARSGRAIKFNTDGSNERVRITSDGDVGIGTDSPASTLEVAGKLTVTQTENRWAVVVESATAQDDEGAIKGDATSTAGVNTVGVWGIARASGTTAGQPIGVRGDARYTSPTGSGQFGVLGYNYTTAGSSAQGGAGVWGGTVGVPGSEGGFNAQAVGVQGESYSKHNHGAGGYFYALSTSSGGQAEGVTAHTASTNSSSYGVFSGGTLGATGTKPAVVYTERQGPTQLYAEEATEVFFSDYGEAQLMDGRARVTLDPLFLETVTIDADHPMHVFIQPYGDAQVYVKRGEADFEVIQTGGSDREAAFSYRLVAKRRHYEDRRMLATEVGIDVHMRPDLNPQERAALNDRWDLEFDAPETHTFPGGAP